MRVAQDTVPTRWPCRSAAEAASSACRRPSRRAWSSHRPARSCLRTRRGACPGRNSRRGWSLHVASSALRPPARSNCNGWACSAPLAELAGHRLVAGDAERADVLQIGVAAFHHRDDMVRLPPRLAALGDGAALEQRAELAHAVGEGEAHDAAAQLHGVEAADGTDAAVALEDAVAQVARAGAEPPLMHARVRAERSPPPAHLPLAPPARPPHAR